MELIVKSSMATIGKVMVDFNKSFPLIFIRFYKSNEFSLANRHSHKTKVSELTSLPVSLSFTENETLEQLKNKLSKAFKVYVELVYYPKDKESAYRFDSDELKLSLLKTMIKGKKEGWMSEKDKKLI
jgi:hypothetical protein